MAAGGGRYEMDGDRERAVIDMCFCPRQVGSSEVVDPINPATNGGEELPMLL